MTSSTPRASATSASPIRRSSSTRPIKEIERRLGEPVVTLSSFIISNTPSHMMRLLWAIEKTAMDSRNILFQEEDNATYIRNMMHRIVAAPVG